MYDKYLVGNPVLQYSISMHFYPHEHTGFATRDEKLGAPPCAVVLS